MTHNITFNGYGEATTFHLIDADGDIAIFDIYPGSGFDPNPDVTVAKHRTVEFDRDDLTALALFVSGECDDFPEPRWSDHDVVRWFNGVRWSTFIRVGDDRWIQVSDDGATLPNWHDHGISRLVDGDMYQDTDTQKVEVIRQKLA